MSDAAPKIANPLIVALLVVGGVLLIGVGLIIGLLLTRNDQPVAAAPSPTASATPTPTVPAEPVAAPAPQLPDPDPARFTSFYGGPHDVTCQHSPFGDPSLEISWESKHAVSAWIGVNVDDAYGQVEIPVSGGSEDIPADFLFPCHQPQATFTLTLVGEDGGHDSRSFTVLNDGQVYDD